MFIGHYAVGFAAKKFAPRSSLGILIAAPTLLDLLWPAFLLIGLEDVVILPVATRFNTFNFISYPISHGLVAVIAWATLLAVGYQMLRRYSIGSIVIWILVLSHWLLDFIVHRRDLPLYAGSKLYGLGLWNHPAITLVVEILMYAIGVGIYASITRAKNAIGKWGFWSFAVVLLGLYVASLYSPPPTSVRKLAIVTLIFGWLMVLWAWWFDKHREMVEVS